MESHPLLPSRELAAAVLWPLRILTTLLIAASLLLLLFWAACVTLFYTSWNHETQPLLDLLHAAMKSTGQGEPFSHVGGLAETIASWLHQTLFLRSGVQSLVQGSASDVPVLGGAIRSISGLLAPALGVVMLSTQVFGARVALLAGMAPLILLGYALAYSDGCAERAIRRACAGRESANIYHRAKYFQLGLLGALLVTTLCLPVHVPPGQAALVFGALVTVFARVQWTYYKKYF